jgi:hypothetical protein
VKGVGLINRRAAQIYDVVALYFKIDILKAVFLRVFSTGVEQVGYRAPAF